MIRTRIAARLSRLIDPWPLVRRHVQTARTVADLKNVLGWTRQGVVEGEYHLAFESYADINSRRFRDAELMATACANVGTQTLLEIGTAYGHMTAVMAQNAPRGMVHTVNIPPEEITAGGKLVTYSGKDALSREQIGSYYRELGLTNVRQILANTAAWEPDFSPINLAFIDGCHDPAFVYNDTRKVLSRCQPGSVVIWHDFNIERFHQLPWIGGVLAGVEKLYREGLLCGPIYHLQDSLMGLFRVPGKTINSDLQRSPGD